MKTRDGDPILLIDLMRRTPDWEQTFLLGVMLLSGFVTAPQAVTFGQTSGLGLWTIFVAGGAWLLWLVRPYYPRELALVLLPLVLLSVYSTLSLSWGGVSVKALQNLAVALAFTGCLLLTARECERDPSLAMRLHRALDIASIIAACIYTLGVLLYGQGADIFFHDRDIFAARPFALFAAVAVARQAARWQGGDFRGFIVGAWLVTLVFLSQSRLGMVACLALFPLAMCCRGDARSIRRAAAMAGIALAILIASIRLSKSMYERFFGYDANLTVGGVAFNSSGRAEMWAKLIDSLHGAYVFFGKGVGGAGSLIDLYFPGLGHPHNDFLRYWYDFGFLGLGLWVAFLVGIIVATYRALRDCVGRPLPRKQGRAPDHPDLPLHLAPILALLAVIASMFTDNSVSYIFVMAPLAMLIGASLSRRRAPVDARPASGAAKSVRLPRWDKPTLAQGPAPDERARATNGLAP